ncbi:MAG: hypothetical protein V7750_09935 [Sneathiella sp.]
MKIPRVKLNLYVLASVSFLALTVSMPASAVSTVFGSGEQVKESTQNIVLAASKLGGSAGYNLKEMHSNLDQVDKRLKQSNRFKTAHKQATEYFEEAESYHRKITEYHLGEFDNSHPDWVAAIKRLKDTRDAIEQFHQVKVLGKPPVKVAAPAKVGDEPLNSLVVYEISKADADLQGVRELLSDTERGESRLQKARGDLAEAERKHQKIREDFKGKFSTHHPDYLAAVERVEATRIAILNYEKNQPAKAAASSAGTPAKSAPKKAQTSAMAKPKQKVNEGPIDSNVAYKLKEVVSDLNDVDKFLDPAVQFDTGPAGRISKAEPLLKDVDLKIESIRRDYAGKFSESHSTFSDIIARISTSKASVKNYKGSNKGALTAKATYDSLSSANRQNLAWLRGHLKSLAVMSPEQNSLTYGNNILHKMETSYSALADALKGKAPADDPILMEIEAAIVKGRAYVAAMPERIASKNSAKNSELDAKHQAAASKIHTRFKDLGYLSDLHRERVGTIVWSQTELELKDGDASKLTDKFKLTDPIYGRAFLPRSLGNTPVLWPGGADKNKPHPMDKFAYELRVFFNGQELQVFRGAFSDQSLAQQHGQLLTVLPITPNPIPAESGNMIEAEAWRKVTNKMPAGTYNVRFEMRGGRYGRVSAKPIAVGEFKITRSKGERIFARGKFPSDNFDGQDINILKSQIKKNLNQRGVAPKSILNITITDDWVFGAFTDTKVKHRSVPVAILEADKDGDGVCEYRTTKFRSRLAGDEWSVLREISEACMNCDTGEIECPK